MLTKNQTLVATRASRQKIGFPADISQWRHSPAVYSAGSLSICGHPVMENWETPYMKVLSEIACQNGGAVLEVGFGMGIASGFIQAAEIFSHTVIEANAGVFIRLLEFAKNASRPVSPTLGFWEEICPGLPSGGFSGILFDTYPLSEGDIHQNHYAFFREAYRLLCRGGALTYYSDEARDFSPEHLELLRTAGFTDIGGIVCPVRPPPDCQYWQQGSFLAPIIRK